MCAPQKHRTIGPASLGFVGQLSAAMGKGMILTSRLISKALYLKTRHSTTGMCGCEPKLIVVSVCSTIGAPA